jgi:glycosyltransferase involved in cell wall biosynthesis
VSASTVDVSVVVAVRDGARYLAAALDSVLAQDPSPREVIAVDDGSTDDTMDVLERYSSRVRTLQQPPSGQPAALNTGIAAATSEWLAFVDADDEWTPASLALRLKHVAPDVDLVSGRVEQFVSPELPPATQARFRFDPEPSRGQVFGSLLVRRSVLARVGELDESLPSASTIDWISRARSAGVRMVLLDDVVLRRRLHERNLGVTNDDEVTRRALRDVVRAHHARRHEPPA